MIGERVAVDGVAMTIIGVRKNKVIVMSDWLKNYEVEKNELGILRCKCCGKESENSICRRCELREVYMR